MKRLEKHPVFMGFVGVIVGAILVGIFQFSVYKSERKDIRIAKKEQILADMYLAYAKISQARNLQAKIRNAPNEEVLSQIQLQGDPILADIFANVLMVNKMSSLYFGKETKILIDSVFSPNNHKSGWWNIPNATLNRITETMAQEINKDL